jgi:hypothetical protein
MQAVLSIFGCVVAGICAALLLRAFRKVRTPLLLWSGLCFLGLALSSLVAYVDIYVLPDTPLYTWRLALSAASLLLLVYGLIFESD